MRSESELWSVDSIITLVKPCKFVYTELEAAGLLIGRLHRLGGKELHSKVHRECDSIKVDY